MTDKKRFTQLLMRWNQHQNQRQMPWKGERDAYKIWLSEIILQQTRVEQGWAYYEKFIRHYPTIGQLAAAPDEEVFKHWEGLGYYSRCKNLLATARYIAQELGGHFPNRYEDILQLKGVGPYTAAAIASFAWQLPHAVVDGNVFRVLARCFGIDTATDSTAGKKQFTALAQQLLDTKAPGAYNQAIMDFGATICKPVGPLCDACPLAGHCVALQSGRVQQLPVKEKAITIKQRWFYYIIIEYRGQLFIRKRSGKDIWQNLHEFLLYESATELQLDDNAAVLPLQSLLGISRFSIRHISPLHRQQLTHQRVSGQFIHLIAAQKPRLGPGFIAVAPPQIRQYAFPRLITDYLDRSAS